MSDWPDFVIGTRQEAQVIADYLTERRRQNTTHPDTPKCPDGTGDLAWTLLADAAKLRCDAAYEAGELTWLDVLREEVMEAFAEVEVGPLREELVQCMAVCGRWIEALDARGMPS